jgi:predicted ATPase
MITSFRIENFTVFEKLDLGLSPKINIIIGNNGTGKTHLLKAIYALSGQDGAGTSTKKAATNLTEEFLRLFMPNGNKINALHADGADQGARILLKRFDDTNVKVDFNNRSTSLRIESDVPQMKSGSEPVFIPTKEVLSLVSGLRNPNHDPATIEMIFDGTYVDLAKQLVQTGADDDSQSLANDPRFSSVVRELVDLVGGRYKLDRNGGFLFEAGKYMEKAKPDRSKSKAGQMYQDSTVTRFSPTGKNALSSNMTAEGFRKVGVLHRLLCNGVIAPGDDTPLIWDEPESNLNPKLMKQLVQALLELSRNGQQIILATHDYVLLKWFDLLMDEGKEDHVLFHSLYRDPDRPNVKLNTTPNYLDISPNPIDEAFGYLIDHEIDNGMGDLGR